MTLLLMGHNAFLKQFLGPASAFVFHFYAISWGFLLLPVLPDLLLSPKMHLIVLPQAAFCFGNSLKVILKVIFFLLSNHNSRHITVTVIQL